MGTKEAEIFIEKSAFEMRGEINLKASKCFWRCRGMDGDLLGGRKTNKAGNENNLNEFEHV